MANDRPSNRPGGYWIAGSPAGIPAHTYPQWLLDLMGPSLGSPPTAEEQPEGEPTFPVPYGPNGNVLAMGRPMMPSPMNALRRWGYGS